jgi:hypothetical protein
MKHILYYDLIAFDPYRNEFSRIPSYWFFDRHRIDAGPIVVGGGVKAGLYTWSPDNQAEIERGWIVQGETIEEVAGRAGILEPERATLSIREYNNACALGHDPFGRAVETLVALDQPPFFCVPLWPGGSNTCGGPRRNEKAQVVDVFGLPIAGLCAAGELGQPIGRLYPSRGADLSDCFCSGQLAAESLLKNG